ncbi:hypothetical protein Tco_1469446 [Tanacetum coccineum]
MILEYHFTSLLQCRLNKTSMLLVSKIVYPCSTKTTMFLGLLVFFVMQRVNQMGNCLWIKSRMVHIEEVKQMEADDQEIQTIIMGLPEDIYAAVDSFEIAQEIWLRIEQMMKGFSIEVQEKKA